MANKIRVRSGNSRYGLWWLPGFPQQKVKGELLWSREQGGILKLQSTFPDPILQELARAPARPYTAETILGEIEPGLLCTLSQNITTQLGPQPQFHSMYLMEGAHFESVSEIRPSNISFRLRHLETWTNETPLEPSTATTTSQAGFPTRLQLKPVNSPFTPTHLLDCNIQAPREGQISLIAVYQPRFGFRRFVFEQVSSILISSTVDPFDFGELLMLVHDCSSLFTLLIADDAGVFDLAFRCKVKEEDVRVRLFYPGMKRPTDSELHPDDMLLALSHIPNASTVISAWINEAPKLRRVADWLTLSTRMPVYSETEFLSYVQAAETLHRIVNPSGQFIDPTEYSKVEAVLVSSIPAETQNDLKQKLKTMLLHGNEFSLRRRLRELLKAAYPSQESTISRIYGNWIEEVVKTRNFLIHNDQKAEQEAASGQRLFELTAGLRGLVTTVLLTRVGVPLKAVLHAVTWRGWSFNP